VVQEEMVQIIQQQVEEVQEDIEIHFQMNLLVVVEVVKQVYHFYQV
jgi:hypothetical protein